MAPLAPCRFQEVVTVPLRSTKSDTLPEAFLISKQAVPYQTHGGTCCLVGLTPKNRPLADSSKSNHKPWGSQPSPPYHNLAQTSASIYDQNTTIIPQDKRLRVNSHLAGWKTRATHSSLSRKITDHSTSRKVEDYNNSLSHKITDHKSSQHLTRWKTWTMIHLKSRVMTQQWSYDCGAKQTRHKSSI
jgi:hypothetical protein